MARRKETITQVDFSYGAARPESAEREDTPLVLEGLKEALNTVSLTTGGVEGRPGLLHIGETSSKNGHDIDLGAGRVFDIHIVSGGIIIYDKTGDATASFTSTPWDSLPGKYGSEAFDPAKFWVLSDPDTSTVILGASSYPTHAAVLLDDGTWEFGEFLFNRGLNGAIRQPYWPYYPHASVTPSGRSGSITLSASSPIFTLDHEGTRIRLGGREVLIDSYVSDSVMDCTVIEQLAPTYTFTLASSDGYTVGDAVEHETLGGQGIITAISGLDVTVLATALWDGFSSAEKLIGPNAAQAITAQVDAAPAATFVWDMQMGSAVHGYPGSGAKHKGRAYLCRYPSAPNAFAVSSAQSIDDFTLGVNDGDGFVEALGANLGGDLLFIISSEDLLFFTTRGLYYQATRGGQTVTPTTIEPIVFSQLGCSEVRPVAVDDGAIFVDAVGEQVYAAILAGDVQRSWVAQNISQYHPHLFNSPVFLGGTQAGSVRPENFIYVTNSDGSVAVAQWDRSQSKVGWRPWETDGDFISVYQALGRIWAVVDRSNGTFSGRFRERFQDGIYLDCASGVLVNSEDASLSVGDDFFMTKTKLATHLEGATAAFYLDGWDLGDGVVLNTGVPETSDGRVWYVPSWDGVLQVGLPFTIRVTPWPRRSTQSQRGVREVKRVIKVFITVMNTLNFQYEGGRFGGYLVGDDLEVPPKLSSKEYGVITGGRAAYVDRPIVSDRPGPFRILKIRQRVTV